jgi:NADPH-dependent glutamate synthase beta subunit-like oxidoreductase
LQDSPAYRLNHEEVQKALEEGINFVECMNPSEAVPDEFGAIKALIFERLNYVAETGKFENTGEMVEFPARTVCVAAGTSPNVIYEKEKPGTFKMDEWRQFFEPHEVRKNGDGKQHAVASKNGFFTSYEHDGKFISYYGDNHPRYAGNVVKAMASAKARLRESSRDFRRRTCRKRSFAANRARCDFRPARSNFRRTASRLHRQNRTAHADDY